MYEIYEKLARNNIILKRDWRVFKAQDLIIDILYEFNFGTLLKGVIYNLLLVKVYSLIFLLDLSFL